MITVGGIGPGNPKYLTEEVKEAIEKSSCVLAFGRVADSLKSIKKDYIKVTSVKEVLNYSKANEDILILASGDPCFYGILEYLKKKNVVVDKVLPGVSSFQYMMAKINKSWQNALFLSLHGRKEDLSKVKSSSLTVLLTDKENCPSYISSKLYELGVRGKIYAGFNLSYEDELIIKKDIGEEIIDISPLAVVVVENEIFER